MQNMDSGASNGWYIYYDSSYSVSFGTVTNGYATSLYAPAGAQNDEWDMVTVVRTGLTGPLLYINGHLVDSKNLPSPSSSPSSLKFASNPAFNDSYNGDLWLPQIWSTPLSAQQVASLYFNQKAGFPWP